MALWLVLEDLGHTQSSVEIAARTIEKTEMNSGGNTQDENKVKLLQVIFECKVSKNMNLSVSIDSHKQLYFIHFQFF